MNNYNNDQQSTLKDITFVETPIKQTDREKLLPMSEIYEEVLSRREVKIDDVLRTLNESSLYFSKFGINNKKFNNPELIYSQPQRGKIFAVLTEGNGLEEEIKSQEFVFTPYGVKVDDNAEYKYECAKLNKIYLENINNEDENYVNDYIDFLIASFPTHSERFLAISVAERLAMIKRFPLDVYEFANSGYNTENINSKLGYLNINSPSEMKSFFARINGVLKDEEEMFFENADEHIKHFSKHFAEIAKLYEIDKLSELQSEEKDK